MKTQTATMIDKSIQLRRAIRAEYAWPGGYPMFVVMQGGAALCMECARKEYKQIAYATRNNLRDGWAAECADINYEDNDLFCDHCNAQIESAYGND